MTASLINALQNPALYPHPVTGFELIETHISWVLLTGPYAYKIKKPVNFGFLDFSTLEARQHFCNEELRLNQRLAPDLYLEVIAIGGNLERPMLGDTSTAFEYALKMRQFPQTALLTYLYETGVLEPAQIDEMAQQIGQFHLNTPVVPDTNPAGNADSVMAPVKQNFEQIRPFLTEATDIEQLQRLEDWAEDQFNQLQISLETRKHTGFIRECHGDLHLGNAAYIEDHITLFDCIEFNEPFRFTDVIADIAFLAMDLEYRDLKGLANRLISQYAEVTQDYAGLVLLPFYKAYRALVRAKIALFSLDHQSSDVGRAALFDTYRRYADLAEDYCDPIPRFLAITHGISGSGKSRTALAVVERLGALRIRSDVQRLRLYPLETTSNEIRYSPTAGARTYASLEKLAEITLQAGFPVVLDATYLHNESRSRAHRIAEANGVPFLILDCIAPMAVIAERLAQRAHDTTEPSEATFAVAEAQAQQQDALTTEERGFVCNLSDNPAEWLILSDRLT